MTAFDKDTTVIVEIKQGAVQDYYVPDGIHIIIVDYDCYDCLTELEDTDPLEAAAIEFMHEYRARDHRAYQYEDDE